MTEMPDLSAPATSAAARLLMTELQSHGMRLTDPDAGAASRRGGAGPSDHKAVTVDGITLMVPVHTAPSYRSPFVADAPGADGRSVLRRDAIPIATVAFPRQPKFYGLRTAEGIAYSQIATLHGADVLATTVLQTCIRYESRRKACKFCAIGQSLAAGRTIERKTPGQLAEVAKAAVELDGVKHMVMTTGTPPTRDRGAAILAESAQAIRAAVDLPLQAQCEPPDTDAWFRRLKDAGVDTLGMHLEVIGEALRRRLLPGKAEVPLGRYWDAFGAAVEVFGRGQVSTYLLAGLGDAPETILATGRRLLDIGVYPFVVPFVPIAGTPLEDHPAPSADFMRGVLEPLGRMAAEAGIRATDIKAGCGKCAACSTLSRYEAPLAA